MVGVDTDQQTIIFINLVIHYIYNDNNRSYLIMEEKESKEVLVMRIEKDLKDRLSKLAGKRKATLTSLTNEALIKYLEQEEYNFDDFMDLVKKIPSLNLHKDIIEKEMKGCPAMICKQAIDIIDHHPTFVFEEKFESIDEKIKSLEGTQDVSGIFLHISVQSNHTNEINEILKNVLNVFGNKIKSGAVIKQNPQSENKILVFVAYNKKEEDKHNGKS